MPNTYTQIHIHLVCCVKNRLSLIRPEWEERLFQYITGIIQNNGHKLLAMNGYFDHIHILFGMRPVQSLSDLAQDIKGDSSRWINQNSLVPGRFSWQEGYGAFSYSKSQLTAVGRYIRNQKYDHSKQSFIDEYRNMLADFGINYDERYLFKPVM